METNDYVSYELALKLKQAGFDEPCDHYYHIKNGVPEDDMWFTHGSCADFNNYKRRPDDFVSAPFLWQTQKWLREGAMLHVGAYPAVPTRKWHFYIDDLNQHVNPHDGELITRWDEDMQEKADERLYDSYECALSAGIYAALELIEQENK